MRFSQINKFYPFIIILLFICVITGYAQTPYEQRINKGMDSLNKAMCDEAIAEFTGAIEIDPKSAFAYYQRGFTYHKKGRLNEAISDYDKAIEIDPNDAEFYYNRGIAYYYKDYPDQAILDWSRAIEISPDTAAIYQKRAFAYFKKEEYDKSWQDVHRIEELEYKVDPKFLEELKRLSQRDK